MKAAYSNDTCTPMFTVALFTIAMLWNHSSSPSRDEYIKEMWYIYTVEFYSAIKNTIMSFAEKWMEQEIIVLSEINQTHKYFFLQY
jgi:hypothetical protein